MRSASQILLSALLATAAPAALAAEAGDAADDTASIIVTGIRDDGYQVRSTGTATRTDTPLLDTPQTIDIFSRDRLDDQAILSIGDALRYVPGAFAAQGEGHRDQIVLRGNNSSADFFVDGVRDDAQYFRDFYNIERLEILKGPNALTFGRGGGGGIVNRVTKTPGAGRFGEATAAVDTFGAWRLAGDVNTPVAGGLSARLNGFYENGRNHRQVYDFERWGVNPSLGVDLGGRGNAVIAYEHVADYRVVDRGVPSDSRGVATGAVRFPLRGFRDTFFGNADINRSRFNADVLTFAADYALTEKLTIRNRTRYADYEKLYVNLFPAGPILAATATQPERLETDSYSDAQSRQNFFTQTDLVWKTELLGTRHTLLAGFEVGRQITRTTRRPGSRATVAFTDPFIAPVPVFASSGSGFRRVRSDADIVAGFIQDQIEFGDHVELLAGVRYDRFTLGVDNLVDSTRLVRTDNLWSPRVGLVIKPAANASLYGSYTRSYLPQSGDQFGTLDPTTATLKPERFDNYEVGAKWDITAGLNLAVAAYQLDRSNTRANDPATGLPVQTGRQRSKGIEASLTGKILPNWQVAAGFALQDAEIRSTTTAAPAGRKVPLVPRTQLSLWSRYDISPKFGVGAGIVHQDRSFATISNAVVLPAWTRVDAALYVAVSKAVELQVNIENLFDTTYFPTAHTDNNITTGTPRVARFTLRSRF
ncbi:TonB-dependent receptor [alpha proteobacterium AAP81b]|nr:TonB-dependent receptor [alpha proteobacterium AAP81b]